MRGSYPCAASVTIITRDSVLGFVIDVIDQGIWLGIVGPLFQLSSSHHSSWVGNNLNKIRVLREGVISVEPRGTTRRIALN